jgi:hypothetical protein
MTTINRFRVVSIEGRRITLHADHVYGWDWDTQLVSSRTMALSLLWETVLGYIELEGLEVQATQAPELAQLSPLGEALAGRAFYDDEAWNRANVGQLISCVGVADRQDCDEMWADCNHEGWDHPTVFETKPRPQATFLIAVTDPRWLAHLAPGMEWNSTAYNHDAEVIFNPAWRTSDACLIAKGIDGSQDFSGLPILADALQEAGCTSDDLLNHLRDPHATHVRGCWALDLVLGKE